MRTALISRGLVVAGGALLLVVGGVAVADAVGGGSGPVGPELGPPVVVDATSHPSTPGTGGPATTERSGDDDDHRSGPAVVGPVPAHEVDDDDRPSSTTHR